MSSQVGSGHVAIFPTFKGFRSEVNKEASSAGASGGGQFDQGFRKATKGTGAAAGKTFKDSFNASTSGLANAALKTLTSDVAKSSAQVSASRLKEQDAAGKVRVAEAGLADARKKYASDSVQVVRAEERLESSSRGLQGVQATTRAATERLSASQRELAAATERANNEARQAPSLFSRMGSSFRSAGTSASGAFKSAFDSGIGQVFAGATLANAATGAGVAIGRGLQEGVALAFRTVGLASDLGEALNANKVAFGREMADQLEILGRAAPKNLALSRRAFAGFATQFSAFARAIRGNDVVGFIDELTTRGADFASVYNLEAATALELFQSGLAGETEPLRRFGLDLSAATVQAFAYSHGIGVVGTELTETQKQQARYGTLMEQTASVQGDATNTAGEYAGQQRRLNVAVEEAQVAFGSYLIPAFTAAATFANTTLIPALGGIVDKVGPVLAGALTEAGPKFEELFAKAEPLITKLVTAGAQDGIPAFVGAMDSIVTAAPDWIDAFNQADAAVRDMDSTYRDLVTETREGGVILRGAYASNEAAVAAWATSTGLRLGEAIRLYGGFASDVVGSVGRAQAAVGGFTGAVAVAFVGLPSQLQRAGRDAFQGFVNGLVSKASDVYSTAKSIADNVVRTIKGALDSHSPSRRLFAVGEDAGEGFRLGIVAKTPSVQSAARHMVALPSLPTSSASVDASLSAGAGEGSGNVYIDKIVAPDQNPVVSGRIMAAEFLKRKAG